MNEKRQKADGGLRAIIQKYVTRFQWSPIETGLTIPGVPDIEFCTQHGVQGWIECKRTDGFVIGLSTFQIGWIERRARYGGRVFIAVWRKQSEFWLLSPTIARTNSLAGMGPSSDKVLLFASGEPSEWPWDQISRVLGAEDGPAPKAGRIPLIRPALDQF